MRRVGEAFLAYTLPKSAWTHEAHLATCVWLLEERADIGVDAESGELVRGYNASVGGVSDATQGYHETITRASVAGVRWFLAGCADEGLVARVNALLLHEVCRRDWPLRFWSPEVLFSPEARLVWVEPDLKLLPKLVSGEVAARNALTEGLSVPKDGRAYSSTIAPSGATSPSPRDKLEESPSPRDKLEEDV